MKVKSLSRGQLLATPWTAAYQAPPSMGFSRQEYWSGVPLPSPWGRGYVTPKLASPLGVFEPIDTTKPKIGRRKDLLLLAANKNNGDLFQSNISLNSGLGKF